MSDRFMDLESQLVTAQDQIHFSAGTGFGGKQSDRFFSGPFRVFDQFQIIDQFITHGSVLTAERRRERPDLGIPFSDRVGGITGPAA